MLTHVRRTLWPVVLGAAALCLLLGVFHRSAQAQTTALPTVPLVCEDGDQPGGARYRICLPAGFWNGDLVVYAHGYVSPNAPVGLPEDQLTIGGVAIADVVTLQGYAFAASSYRRNGLSILEGIDDLVELVALFTDKHGAPRRVLLTGVSEGGAITVLALERHPEVFDGGLALCGPYGDFQRQINYFTDFRTVFDFFFPGVIPGAPITIPDDLLTTWETAYYSTTVKPLLLDPAGALSVTQIVSVTGAIVDASAFPTSTEATFDRLLWYNVISTNDAKARLGGNPFGNLTRVYTGALDDVALNQGLFRTAADPAATTAIQQHYETTGRLRVPLITLHTLRDDVTPYWHATTYAQKVVAAGSAPLYEHRAVDAFGHCNFTVADVQAAFASLAARAFAHDLYLPFITAENGETGQVIQ
ncbi:MAG TPA: prolyl oligopeptidase family serine peptidase [Chloroflexi bacterium]|nr:prolyl oligopeptidase family serine peptidase [Chloroflexota bacterium]